VAPPAQQQQVAAGRRNTAVRKQRVGTQRVRHSLGTQYANSSFSVGGAAVATVDATEAYVVCARQTERRDVHVVEAVGGAVAGSYAQEAAAVEEDEEMEREDERGAAKRPDLNGLDVPDWAEWQNWHWIKQNGGSPCSAPPPSDGGSEPQARPGAPGGGGGFFAIFTTSSNEPTLATKPPRCRAGKLQTRWPLCATRSPCWRPR
jgi:hypothetical protein